jgi:asparagine synthase (glutamine-hydrolysing)
LYDETEENRDYLHARTVVNKYPNIDHRTNKVSQSDITIDNLDLITYHMEEVIWDKVYWSMFTNYKNASDDGLRVIINGQGSDEVWLGYYHDFPHYKFDKVALKIPNLIDHFLERNLEILPYLNQENYSVKKVMQIIKETLEKNYEPYNIGDEGNAIAAWATKTYLQSNLMQEDRMSMASSVECRVPFTDHRIVEVAFSIPSNVKTKGGVEKWPLKEVGRRYLPAAICERQKMAFVNPSARYNEQIQNYLLMNKDEISTSEIMNRLFSTQFFESLSNGQEFSDPELSWKVVAIHRFLKIYNF